MVRKRVTQIFPCLLSIRKKQRCFCFYTGMHFDGNHYASVQLDHNLSYIQYQTDCPLYNHDTGFDMQFQENKVFNLQLAANTLNGILIRPNETFSFWHLVRYANKEIPYKDGLTVIDGKLTTAPGGGMCQMSNLLFWMFLHSPLSIVERHGHEIKDFPDLTSDAPIGVDATVAEGWLDLKVKNNTEDTFQICIAFQSDRIIGILYVNRDTGYTYEIMNGKTVYYKKKEKIYESAEVIQKMIRRADDACVHHQCLYINCCEIGYPLPAETEIIERENN